MDDEAEQTELLRQIALTLATIRTYLGMLLVVVIVAAIGSWYFLSETPG